MGIVRFFLRRLAAGRTRAPSLCGLACALTEASVYPNGGSRSVPEADAYGAGSANQLSLGRDGFHLTHCVGDVDRGNFLLLQANHAAKFSFRDQIDGGHAEAGG